MLVSIISTKSLLKAIPFVPERNRKPVMSYLLLHRGLMIFFFLGYILVMFAFAFRYSLFSETLVSIIFLFGAIFVFIGINVQSRLFTEVQQTIQGLLPICCKCKKIRIEGGKQEDPKSWQMIETYIKENTDVDFTHGFCPDCFRKEVKHIEEKRKS